MKSFTMNSITFSPLNVIFTGAASFPPCIAGFGCSDVDKMVEESMSNLEEMKKKKQKQKTFTHVLWHKLDIN